MGNLRFVGRPTCLGLLLACSAAMAGPVWTVDPYNDRTGPAGFEVYQLGYEFAGDNLNVTIRTNYPSGGLSGTDTYGTGLMSPGDLYINVGGSHNGGTGSVYGLGLTSHSGDLTLDWWDNGLPWSSVTAGHLYSGATFATGTYEGYPNAGFWDGTPYDGGKDPYNHDNNLPALIAGYSSDLGYQGAVNWNQVNGQSWQYEITASVSLADLNLYDQPFELWWTMECGNDAIKATGCAPPVPEPASLAFLGLGLVGLLRRRRA